MLSRVIDHYITGVRNVMMKKLTAVAVLLLCSYVRGQGTCTAFKDHPACGCTLQNGQVIDLSSVGKQDHKPA